MLIADERTFEELVQRHRRELHIHCYRMVASFEDADDLVQEALLRAWNARASFNVADGSGGWRAWLYQIATNACLDYLRRVRRTATKAESFAELPWIEPYPDRLLDEWVTFATPEEILLQRETIGLAYLALIQRLPARQRAILILRDVLDWSAAETATALEITVAAANSGLQRARATLKAGVEMTREPTERERELLAAYIDLHERGDMAGSLALMREDIRVTMPPRPMVYEGRSAIAPLLSQAFSGAMGEWRLVAAWFNRMPAAVSYLKRPGDSVYRAFKIDVLRVKGDLIKEVTTFDIRLLKTYGIPETIED